MKALLDTHALLWWVTDDERLSAGARAIIESEGAVVSVASLWEVEIKRALGRIDVDTEDLVREVAQTTGFEVLDVRPTHILSLAGLPAHHRDPFDRMLIAQAMRERLALVSRDEVLHQYPVTIHW